MWKFLFEKSMKDKFGYKRPPPYYYSGLRAAFIWHTGLCRGMSQLFLMCLPPDNDSLNLHIMRANYLAIYRNHPSPIGHGWEMMNGHWRPVRYRPLPN